MHCHLSFSFVSSSLHLFAACVVLDECNVKQVATGVSSSGSSSLPSSSGSINEASTNPLNLFAACVDVVECNVNQVATVVSTSGSSSAPSSGSIGDVICNHDDPSSYVINDNASHFTNAHCETRTNPVDKCCGCYKRFGEEFTVTTTNSVHLCKFANTQDNKCTHALCKPCYLKLLEEEHDSSGGQRRRNRGRSNQ